MILSRMTTAAAVAAMVIYWGCRFLVMSQMMLEEVVKSPAEFSLYQSISLYSHFTEMFLLRYDSFQRSSGASKRVTCRQGSDAFGYFHKMQISFRHILRLWMDSAEVYAA